MGLESSNSDVLSSDARNVAITEFLEQTRLGASSVGDKKEDVTRGGSLDSSREVDASEEPECAEGDAEADQADVLRNGSLDNARAG